MFSRVKEEPNDTWSHVGANYYFDSAKSCVAKNFKKFPFDKPSANHMNEVRALQQKFAINILDKKELLKLTKWWYIIIVNPSHAIFVRNHLD
uniref:Uncharacterized protein n=1 Tax=Trichogramma kaykai TaxID=54128 RepID=A0ABD2X7A9_9HYME